MVMRVVRCFTIAALATAMTLGPVAAANSQQSEEPAGVFQITQDVSDLQQAAFEAEVGGFASAWDISLAAAESLWYFQIEALELAEMAELRYPETFASAEIVNHEQGG